MGSYISKYETNQKEEDDVKKQPVYEPDILEVYVEGQDASEDNDTTDEISKEEFNKWYAGCPVGKNDQVHKKFIPAPKFCLDQLPQAIRHNDIFDYIRLRAELVVRIKVQYISTARSPDENIEKFAKYRGKYINIFGTGYAWIHSPEQTVIPCPKFSKSCQVTKDDHFVYDGILITTNRHVIFNNEEARETEVEFFHDDKESEKNTVTGFGLSLLEEFPTKDYVSLKIYCHDKSLFQRISDVNARVVETWDNIPSEFRLSFEKYAVVASHPHSYYKMISVGELLEREVQGEVDGQMETRYSCSTCIGSSGAPVLTGFYGTKPFVHSSSRRNIDSNEYVGLSFSY